ncbi:MAG TPA: tetratricopeptide repeat protein, partial [Bacteroidetes bacterium]|nr:tetratricopeptide repeat protein [Bacteroidota bacterium]
LEDFNHAISLNAKNPFIYFQRALTYLKLGDTTATLNDYSKVLSLDPDNALTWYNRALIYSMQEKYDSALASYARVISINPYNVYTYFNRGVLYAQMKKYKKAEADFTRAIEIFPDYAGAYVNRSAVRQRLHDKKGAMEDHDAAMNIIALANSKKGKYEAIYKHYADSAYFKRIIEFEADFVAGDMKKGRVQFQRIPIEPKPDFLLVYAFSLPDSVYEKYKNFEYFDDGISQFNATNTLGVRFVFTTLKWPVKKEQALIEINKIDSTLVSSGDTAGAWFMKGIFNSMTKNYSKAINDYDKTIKKDPSISYAYLNRGTARFELDESIYARQQYSDAITISRRSFGKSQKPVLKPPTYEKVLQDFNRAAALNPNLPFVYYNRANVKIILKKYQRAIDDYSMAIRLEPKMAEAYYNRALTLLFLNEEKLACKDLSKAGELGITEAYNVIKRYCH